MICKMTVENDHTHYRNHICNLAGDIGVETAYFFLHIWDVEMKKLYGRMKELLRCSEKYHSNVVEAACKRANFYKLFSASALKLILTYSLHKLPLDSNTDVWGQIYFELFKPKQNQNDRKMR